MLTYKHPKAKSCVVCERVFVPERDGEEVCGGVCGLKRARVDAAKKVTLEFPWPPKELSPNARLHWAKLAKAKKEYRADCATLARHQGAQKVEATLVLVKLTFHAPTRAKYDLDNALARMKSGLDGLADVLGVDDCFWSYAMYRGEPVKGGRVVLEVEPT